MEAHSDAHDEDSAPTLSMAREARCADSHPPDGAHGYRGAGVDTRRRRRTHGRWAQPTEPRDAPRIRTRGFGSEHALGRLQQPPGALRVPADHPPPEIGRAHV